MDPDQTAPDQGPHCLPVCKNRFEKFARIFSRRHKQTTFSDAGFLGVLRVNSFSSFKKLWVFFIVDIINCDLLPPGFYQI